MRLLVSKDPGLAFEDLVKELSEEITREKLVSLINRNKLPSIRRGLSRRWYAPAAVRAALEALDKNLNLWIVFRRGLLLAPALSLFPSVNLVIGPLPRIMR